MTTTLGYHYDMWKSVFGEQSKATKYLQGVIDLDPNHRDGIVIAVGQLIQLLVHLTINVVLKGIHKAGIPIYVCSRNW